MSKRFTITRDCHNGGGRCNRCLKSRGPVRVVQLETDNPKLARRCNTNWREYNSTLTDNERTNEQRQQTATTD